MSACRSEEIKIITQKTIQKTASKKKRKANVYINNSSLPCTEEYKNILATHLKTNAHTREPAGQSYKDAAEKISSGNWLALDYKTPDFQRTIYKIFRLNLIDSYQLSTALLWQSAIDQFQNKAGQTKIALHSFEDKSGPYDPASIFYATNEDLIEFKNSLKELPAGDRTYLTIDIPAEHELLFSFMFLGRNMFNANEAAKQIKLYDVYQEFLKKLLLKQPHSEKEKNELIKHVDQLANPVSLEILTTLFTKQLKKNHPAIKDIYFKNSNLYLNFKKNGKSRELISSANLYRFMAAILVLAEQFPSLVISPNYNPHDPNTSIASIVLPTTAALMKLQVAVHHTKTVFPEFKAGAISTRDLSKTLIESLNHKRLVELPHPDLPHAKDIHRAIYTPFIQLWHDLYLHIWRAGDVLYKDLIHHLTVALQGYQNVEMSKLIWKLVDMDFPMGLFLRIAIITHTDFNNHALTNYHTLTHTIEFLEELCSDLFSKKEISSDLKLLFLIDMDLYKEVWKASLGKYPEDFFPKKTFTNCIWKERPICNIELTGIEVLFNGVYFTKFQEDLSAMKKIIASHPVCNLHTDAMYYILAFRLQDHSVGMTLLNELANTGLNKIFEWEKNGGIIVHDAEYKSEFTLEKLTGDALYTELKSIHQFINTIKLEEVLDQVVDKNLCTTENKTSLKLELKKIIAEYDLKKEQQPLLIKLMKDNIEKIPFISHGLFVKTAYFHLDSDGLKSELYRLLKRPCRRICSFGTVA